MIWENERNMKEIFEKVRGKLCLQRDVLKFIEKHEREEDRRKNQPAGAPALIDGDGLIKKNSDGTHEPVKVFLSPNSDPRRRANQKDRTHEPVKVFLARGRDRGQVAACVLHAGLPSHAQ